MRMVNIEKSDLNTLVIFILQILSTNPSVEA